MDMLIKNARLVDFSGESYGDIYISQGKIVEKIENFNGEVLDAQGLCLMPSFVDLHCHFREPGFCYKEDIESGSRAALRGGYTFVNLMPNTKPICSHMDIVIANREKSQKLGLVDIHQCLSISDNMEGKSISHLKHADDDVKVITDDGKGVDNSRVMYEAMQWAKEHGTVVLAHAEAMEVTAYDSRLSENLESYRDISLAIATGAKLHLTHLSTKEAMQAISFGKSKVQNISCDVTPHHISLWDNDYRVNPPIREKADVDSLIEGIKTGLVDAIATDHAPHSLEDKQKGSPGLTGLETAFSLCYENLVLKNNISLSRLSEIMSYNPAKIMGINKGCLKVDYDGDLVLIDLNKRYVLDVDKLASKGKNTPFANATLQGEIKATIKAGRLMYDNR